MCNVMGGGGGSVMMEGREDGVYVYAGMNA